MSSASEHNSHGWHTYCKLHVVSLRTEAARGNFSLPLEPVMLYHNNNSLQVCQPMLGPYYACPILVPTCTNVVDTELHLRGVR